MESQFSPSVCLSVSESLQRSKLIHFKQTLCLHLSGSDPISVFNSLIYYIYVHIRAMHLESNSRSLKYFVSFKLFFYIPIQLLDEDESSFMLKMKLKTMRTTNVK